MFFNGSYIRDEDISSITFIEWIPTYMRVSKANGENVCIKCTREEYDAFIKKFQQLKKDQPYSFLDFPESSAQKDPS